MAKHKNERKSMVLRRLLLFQKEAIGSLNAKVAERLRKCLQSITTPVRIRTLALEALKSDGNQEETADRKDI